MSNMNLKIATNRSSRRSGYVMIWAMFLMVTMLAIGTLAVDWGRVQVAKTQLIAAADSAARNGAAGLAKSPADAINDARYAGEKNVVDGTQLVVRTGDVNVGYWNTNTKTFTKLTGSSQYQANAVQVIAQRHTSRSSAVPTTFARVFGSHQTNIKAESIAMLIGAVNVEHPVPATSNPFLSGMPAGSVASRVNPHDNPDYAGSGSNMKQAPQTVGLAIASNVVLTFDSISGIARHDPGLSDYNPDGNAGDIGHNNLTRSFSNNYSTNFYNENGIADVRAPINSLVGIFMDDSRPDSTDAPENLDFSTDASRNFKKLEPKLKQIFFIGDGLDANGKRQEFVAPKGATRLFLATWDFYEWNNNSGVRTVKVDRPQQIITVK